MSKPQPVSRHLTGYDYIARSVFQEELSVIQARNQKLITVEVIKYLKNRIEEIGLKEKNGKT